MRVDSGFWSNDTITTLNRLDVRYTMAVRCGVKTVAAAIAAIRETAWVYIDYPIGGQAQVADTTSPPAPHGDSKRSVTRAFVVLAWGLWTRPGRRALRRWCVPG